MRVEERKALAASQVWARQVFDPGRFADAGPAGH